MTTAQDPATSSLQRHLRPYGLVILLLALITLAHYNTAFHIHALHGIYRRLYYFPIIIAAFRGGTRAGLLCALLVCAVYLPHAMGVIGFDPGTPVEKGLEMVLYLAVGLVSGILVSRINAARSRLERSTRDLQRTLDEKDAVEAELVRTAKLAAVGRLSAGLAHEIRNPLASIKGSAEVLADDYPPSDPKSRLLSILLEETGRLNSVLTQFLAFARSEPGELEPFDLGLQVQAVADLVSHQPDSCSIKLHLPDQPIMAMGNPEQIRQVLLNLTLNAVSVTEPHDAVTIIVEKDEVNTRCLVQDRGPGFSSDALENFGTPFYSTRQGGTGLGLATSLRIVENQGGTLEVDRQYDGGASVVLTLPRSH